MGEQNHMESDEGPDVSKKLDELKRQLTFWQDRAKGYEQDLGFLRDPRFDDPVLGWDLVLKLEVTKTIQRIRKDLEPKSMAQLFSGHKERMAVIREAMTRLLGEREVERIKPLLQAEFQRRRRNHSGWRRDDPVQETLHASLFDL